MATTGQVGLPPTQQQEGPYNYLPLPWPTGSPTPPGFPTNWNTGTGGGQIGTLGGVAGGGGWGNPNTLPMGNAGWRNFTFQNPTNPFQQNFNALAKVNPDAAFSYGFTGRGGEGVAQNSNDLRAALDKMGYNSAAILGAYNPGGFMGTSQMANSIGINDPNWHAQRGNMAGNNSQYTFGGQTYNLLNPEAPNAPNYIGNPQPNAANAGTAGAAPATLGGAAGGNPTDPLSANTSGSQGGAPGFQEAAGNYTAGMTPQDYINPAAAWAREQGLKGLQSTYAGSPYGLNSGAAMKGIGDYLSGSALNQAWQPGFQNYMQDKGFNYGVDTGDRNFNYQAQLNDQQIPFQQQMQLAQLGMGGVSGSASLSAILANILSGNTQALGQTLGTGTMGQGNAISGALQQWLQQMQQNNNPFMQWITQQMQQQKPAGT